MRWLISLLGMSIVCAQVFADEVDFSLNSDALRIQYVHELEASGLNLDAGWLYNQDNGSVFHGGLNLVGLASSGRNKNKLEAGLGGRFVYTDGDNSKQNGFGIPIGGLLRFTPQAMDRLSISGSLYFAPSLLAFGDMDKYQEYTIRVGYNVLRQADLYVGARYVRGDYKNASDLRYDTGMHIGMTLRF